MPSFSIGNHEMNVNTSKDNPAIQNDILTVHESGIEAIAPGFLQKPNGCLMIRKIF